MNTRTAELAAFAANLKFDAIPAPVLRKAEDLLVDWFGSAIAGHGARPVETIAGFAVAMGPALAAGEGAAELLVRRSFTSPYFAAMANAAASHVAEQDDVHNGSVFHPATVVFPVAVALAQARGATGRQLLAAAVAGYEVGIRVGEFLGRSHYKVFHTTGTAGTLAAAAAAGNLLGLDAAQMQHAFGSAGTQSAGLWEFLRTGADSKQLHTAHAAAAGLSSAKPSAVSENETRKTTTPTSKTSRANAPTAPRSRPAWKARLRTALSMVKIRLAVALRLRLASSWRIWAK